MMNTIKQMILSVLLMSASATVQAEVCGIVEKSARGFQIIPKIGKVLYKVEVGTEVECGAMIRTNAQAAWIKLKDQSLVKMGPDTFIEVQTAASQEFRLLKGSFLLSAPKLSDKQIWKTPNAELEFHSGVVLLQYLSTEKKTFAGCFNRSVKFKNRYNTESYQTLSAGEMSSLSILDGRLKPDSPVVMSASSLVPIFTKLGLTGDDENQLTSIVKQIYEGRAHALISGIDSFEESSVETKDRVPASVEGASQKPSSINVEEANFTEKMMRARLYGEDVESAATDRKPANAAKRQPLRDEEGEKRAKRLQTEAKRIQKEIEEIEF